MHPVRRGSLLGVVAIAIAAALWWRSTPPDSPQSETASPAVQSRVSNTETVVQSAMTANAVSRPATDRAGARSIEDDVAVEEYRRYRQFQNDIRALFDATRNAPDPTKLAEASRLARITEWAEREEYLLPVEAFGVHLGLIRAVITDPDDRARRIVHLQGLYVDAAARERAATPPDPRMAMYQRRVAELLSHRQRGDKPLNKVELRTLRQDMTAIRREIFTD